MGSVAIFCAYVSNYLTDRNKGISNAVREKKYQEYVRGWVEYFRLADMKGLLETTDKWARRRIRAVYWQRNLPVVEKDIGEWRKS